MLADVNRRLLVNLTNSPTSQDYTGAWSADGARMAFVSNRSGDTRAVYTWENGTIRRVTGDLNAQAPVWSPDGRHIAYTAFQVLDQRDLFVVDLQTGDTENITDSLRDDISPGWSATGALAYVTQTNGFHSVWVRRADGDSHPLTDPADTQTDAYAPRWSPDGSQIAFVANNGVTADLFVADADGTNIRQVSTRRARVSGPAWSADGQWLAYTEAVRASARVALISLDGEGARTLPTGTHSAAWSHDGRWLAFNSGARLTLVRTADILDTSQRIQPIAVWRGPGIARFPVWRP